MVTGVVGPLLIFLHSGAHYHALVPILAMLSMVIVVVSGIVGQAVHAFSLRALNDQRRRLQHDLLHVDADLTPLVDEPDGDRLVGHRHGAVRQRERPGLAVVEAAVVFAADAAEQRS